MIALLAGLAHASGLLYGDDGYVPLRSVDHAVAVDGRLATGTARYVFDPSPSGATVALALPVGAAATDLRVRLGGDWVVAGASVATTAPPTPDGAPGALLPGDVITASLPAGSVEPVEVEVSWQALLVASDGGLRLEIPLSDGGLNPSDPAVSWSATVTSDRPVTDLSGDPGLSGTAPLSDLGTWTLTWREEPGPFGISVRTYRPPVDPYTGEGEPDGYALVTLLPGPEDPTTRVDTLTAFVIDASASMQGRSWDTAVAGTARWLRASPEDDRFTVVPYTSMAVPFRATAPHATDRSVEAAIAFLERQQPAGLSDPADGLVTGLALLDDTVLGRGFFSCAGTTGAHGPPVAGAPIQPARGPEERVAPYVVWITDGGASTGAVEPDAISEAVAAADAVGASVFAIGVGPDVDRALLQRIAGEHRGEVRYADRVEDVPEVVAALRDRIANPVLVQPRASVRGASQQAPEALPDVTLGTEVVFAFRYRRSGDTAIRLTGIRGQVDHDEVFDVMLPSVATGDPVVARAWAQLRAEDLDRRIRAGDDSVWSELESLVADYGVASEFVVLDFAPLDPYAPTADAAAMSTGSASGCGCATDRSLAGGVPLAVVALVAARRRRSTDRPRGYGR